MNKLGKLPRYTNAIKRFTSIETHQKQKHYSFPEKAIANLGGIQGRIIADNTEFEPHNRLRPSHSHKETISASFLTPLAIHLPYAILSKSTSIKRKTKMLSSIFPDKY